MTIGRAAWAAAVCVVWGSAGHAQQRSLSLAPATVFEGDRQFLRAGDGQVLRHGTVTAAARAVCARMKPAPSPCEWDTILAAARHQTDSAVWIGNIEVGTDAAAPSPCQGGIVLESYEDGGTTEYVTGCPAVLASDPITPATIDVLAAAAARLGSERHETLAEHQFASGLDAYIDALESPAE